MHNNFWNSEKLLGLSALFISLMTLIVFVYQTNLIRKQQYMTVYPHLDIVNNNSGSLNYKYVLENRGVGPAFITSIEVSDLNGNKYDDLVAYVEANLPAKDSIAYHYSDIGIGRLISANEKIYLFGLSDPQYLKNIGYPPNTVEGANKLRAILNSDSLRYKIIYESVYGESWTLSSESSIPVKN